MLLAMTPACNWFERWSHPLPAPNRIRASLPGSQSRSWEAALRGVGGRWKARGNVLRRVENWRGGPVRLARGALVAAMCQTGTSKLSQWLPGTSASGPHIPTALLSGLGQILTHPGISAATLLNCIQENYLLLCWVVKTQ